MSKAKRTTKTAKPLADATATSPPDKPETFETRRGWLFLTIVQHFKLRGFDAKIERDGNLIGERYQLHLARDGYSIELDFRCANHFAGTSHWNNRGKTEWPEVVITCTFPRVTYKPTVGSWKDGVPQITSGVNVAKIVERFELAFRQHQARDEREREQVTRLTELLAEARRINGALGRDIVGITEGEKPELIIRLCNYRGDKIELMAAILATDSMLPVVQSVGDSLDRLEREITSTRKRLSERFTA